MNSRIKLHLRALKRGATYACGPHPWLRAPLTMDVNPELWPILRANPGKHLVFEGSVLRLVPR